jgi:hypothetical protein
MKSSQSNFSFNSLARTDDFLNLKAEKSITNYQKNPEKSDLPPTRHFSIANHLLQSVDNGQRYLKSHIDVNNNNHISSFDLNNNHNRSAKAESKDVGRFKIQQHAQASRMNNSISFCQIDEELENEFNQRLNVKQTSNGFSQMTRFHMKNGNGNNHFNSSFNSSDRPKRSHNGFYASTNGSRSSHYLNHTS